MSTAMVIGLFILILGVLLSPGAVLLFFVCAIGYAVYLCTTPSEVWIKNIIEKDNKKREKQKKKLLDEDIKNFIHGGSYDKFDNEPTFLIMREYRNRLCEELSKNNKIKVNTEGIKKIFKRDITIESEFVEYLKDIYLRRYTISVDFSWLEENERKTVNRLDLLIKYNYYLDLDKKWEEHFKKKKIINSSSYSKIGLPHDSYFWRDYLNRGEV